MLHSMRRATAADADAIAALHDEPLDGALTIVAEANSGEISGFCSMFLPSRDDDARQSQCEVAALYVLPDRWRRGIGRALMRAALDNATGQGYEVVTLWLADDNDIARRFFEDFGFKPDGRTRGRDLRMRLTLA